MESYSLRRETEFVHHRRSKGMGPHDSKVPGRTALLRILGRQGTRVRKEVRRGRAIRIGISRKDCVISAGRVITSDRPLIAQTPLRIGPRKLTEIHAATRATRLVSNRHARQGGRSY